MIINKLKSLFVAFTVILTVFTSTVGFAAGKNGDKTIEDLIAEQEKLVEIINVGANAAELKEEIASLKEQIAALKKANSNGSNDINKRALEAVNDQLADLTKRLGEFENNQQKIIQLISKLEQVEKSLESERNRIGELNSSSYGNYDYSSYGKNTSAYLVNPGPNPKVNYTQDAINSQGNSMMVFKYAPNQLYKIYCRVGYVTDMSFKKGEKISFVGGGDTSAWAVNSTTVDGVAHIYIKPTVDTSTTNLIVTTNKRSYQIILNTSDWYNPMVSWSYGQEDQMEAIIAKEKEERTITSRFNTNVENLNFNYDVSGDSSIRLAMVFDDGEKTIIKFKSIPSKLPSLFIKEKGKKGASLANYTIRDNCYILDRVVDEITIMASDNDKVRIKRKK